MSGAGAGTIAADRLQRVLRVTIAVALLVGALFVRALTFPGGASACSCLPTGPLDIGKAAQSPDSVVFIGMVTAMDPAGPGQDFSNRFGEMQIERIFKGTLPAIVRVKGGGGGDCTMHLAVAQHMITVGSYVGNVLTPMLCNPYADPNTPEGQQLIAAAVAAFGPGVVPDKPPDDDPTAMPDDPDLTGFAIGIVGILVLVVVIAVVASARQRREEPSG